MSKPKCNERSFDYLYDQAYLLSSNVDHERMCENAISRCGQKHVTSADGIFDGSKKVPKSESVKCLKNPLPNNFSDGFNPEDLCFELLTQTLHNKYGYSDEDFVRSRDRAKFFCHHNAARGGDFSRYSIRSGSLSLTSRADFDRLFGDGQSRISRSGDLTSQQSAITSRLSLPLPTSYRRYSNHGTQTDYRDSEMQTEPYSPNYVVSVGETPEVLTLAPMGFNRGLPAGLHDVETIERAQRRRLVESQLEPFSRIFRDPVKVAHRVRLMNQLELHEWSFREKEVDALQEIRLRVLVELLKKRDQHSLELAKSRLDQVWRQRSDRMSVQRARIRKAYLAGLRRLLKQHANSEPFKLKRNIVSDYAKPGSEVYAPLTRNGVFPDHKALKLAYKSPFLNSLEGLLDLEQSTERHYFHSKTSIQPIRTHTHDGYLKREYRNLRDLSQLSDFYESEAVVIDNKPRKPRFLERIVHAVPRPTTPVMSSPEADEKLDRELGATILQQLVRGRAVQTQMFEGKTKRFELIQELRSTHALLEDERQIQAKAKLRIEDMQSQHAALIQEDNKIEDVLGSMESKCLGQLLDFLSKEMDRLIGERRLRAIVLKSERERRMHEAEESGTRQREERRRREHDEIFKQVIKFHQETVDGYLDAVINSSVDSSAGLEASKWLEELSRQVDDEARIVEESRDELRSDLIAAKLVHDFLIPEVDRRSVHRNQEARERKFLQAAHNEIWTAANGIIEQAPYLNAGRVDNGTMTGGQQPVGQEEGQANS